MTEPILDVSDTAFWVAHCRALESERPDALFHDPFSARLAGERGRMITEAMALSRIIIWTMAIRTCIIDDMLRSAIARGVDTVLNLGAGLDARPYRMELPASLSWVEADYPRIVEHKERTLEGEAPRCRLERVKLDLADTKERRALFARVNAGAKQIFVLTEGVIPYLSVEEVAPLADELLALGRVRYWLVDYFSPAAKKYRDRKGATRQMRNAPFRFDPADWFGFFEEHGWRFREVRYLAEEAERLGRPIPLPLLVKIAMKLAAPFLPKERRAAMKHFAGYVLLEPF
ncbi:MAG TPA: SAM-dependent methyltransferase [Burkholderiales bacterium]